MAQLLAVSVNQVLEELGALNPRSAMGDYLCDAWGNSAAQIKAITLRIGEAQDEFEKNLEIYLFQTRVVTTPITAGKVFGTDYDVVQDGYPYSRLDFSQYATVYMRKRPIISVSQASLRYGNTYDVLAAATFPQPWVTPQARIGVLHILPLLGNNSSISAGSLLLLPLISSVMPGNLTVPLIFSIDYTAGFLPIDFDPDTDDAYSAAPDFPVKNLLRGVKYMAAANVLRAVRRAIAPGGGSLNMGGAGQSWSANMFGPDIEDYDAKAAAILQEWYGMFPLKMFSM